MIEKGKVIKVSEGKITVAIMTTSDCAHCSKTHICNLFGENKRIIELYKTIPVREGNEVVIEISHKYQLLSIFLIFCVPVILFVIGVVWGAILQNELFSLIFGGVGFILGFTIVKLINNYLSKINSKIAKIIKVLS
ncbi:MAG: SoxR reducing system RseC family protein [candidate division WOR-3 bacterium]